MHSIVFRLSENSHTGKHMIGIYTGDIMLMIYHQPRHYPTNHPFEFSLVVITLSRLTAASIRLTKKLIFSLLIPEPDRSSAI